ncbi:MAG TPA: preprotein translocase subunit SecE [Candidatus Paceibacterota bacterium]|nr:preprotein translocase subunit SecE [Candidatus Paceibacterota bacterium]HRY76556.1 preprotein translocase subunit SecE [Candidatus Paceibacterota bacterium]
MFAKLKVFFKEVRLEFKRVNWLTKKETIQYTLIVVGMSLGIAIFLGFFDYVFTFVLNKFVI